MVLLDDDDDEDVDRVVVPVEDDDMIAYIDPHSSPAMIEELSGATAIDVKLAPGIFNDSAGSMRLANDQKLTSPSEAAVTNPALNY